MKVTNMRVIIASTLIMLFLTLSSNASEGVTKIAVASMGSTMDSPISPQAGRAPFFLFFDDQGRFVEAVKNPVQDNPRNAGPSAALFLIDQKVTIVIAENFGSKMEYVLDDNHIEYIKKKGDADDAVQTILKRP